MTKIQRAPHTLPHLSQRVFGTPLMISRNGLDVVLAVMAERLELSESPTVDISVPASKRNRKSYATTDDGIAVISIVGPLVYRESGNAMSGGPTSYGEIEDEFMDAATDPAVKGILMDIDSPGGEVSGCFDLVDMMYQARATKPIVAAVNDSGFSAAYAIASAADQIFVTRTGGVGSVGVIAMHLDQSGFDAKLGTRYTAVFAGQRKNDYSPHAPLSDGAAASLQGEVDRLYELFASTVARNRGLNAEDVRKTEAGLFWGAQGVPMFADAVGTPADAIAALRSRLEAPARASGKSASAEAVSVVIAAAVPDKTKPEPDEDDQKDSPDDSDEDDQKKSSKQTDNSVPCDEDEDEKIEGKSKTAASAANPVTGDEMSEQNKPADAQPSVINAAQEIASLCMIAGQKELTADFITQGLTVAQARDKLLELRAQATDEISIRSHVGPKVSGAIENLERQAEVAAATGTITKQQAFARALRANPSAYTEYMRQNPQLDGGKTADAFGR